MSDVRLLNKRLKQWYIYHFSYTCNKFENLKGASLLMWNTSVSDHCCHHCDGVVYKADAVIDTIHHKDECQTVETSVCRTIPGLLFNLLSFKQYAFLKVLTKLQKKLNFHIRIAVMMKQVKLIETNWFDKSCPSVNIFHSRGFLELFGVT